MLYNLRFMERGAVHTHVSLLESEKIGREPAFEWVEKQLKKLRQKYNLSKFQVDPRDYELWPIPTPPRVKELLGQEEIGQEAVGFIAGYIDGELRMLSVFVDLGDRIARIQKNDYKKETFLARNK